MIHYSCDLCNRTLRPAETRFVLKIDVFVSLPDPVAEETEDADADHLEELSEILEQLDDEDVEAQDEGRREMRFDLCPECHKRFLKDPLGREALLNPLNFSSN